MPPINNNRLDNVIFAQRVIAFGSIKLQNPLKFSLVCNSWQEAVLDYGAASLAWKNQLHKPEVKSVEEIDDEQDELRRKREKEKRDAEEQQQNQANNRNRRFGFGFGHQQHQQQQQREEAEKREAEARQRSKNKDFYSSRLIKAQDFFFNLLAKGKGILAAWALEETRKCGYWDFLPFEKKEDPNNNNNNRHRHFFWSNRDTSEEEDITKKPQDFKQALLKLFVRGNWPEGLKVLLLEKEIPRPENLVEMLCKVINAGHVDTIKLLLYDEEINKNVADFRGPTILNNICTIGYEDHFPLGIAAGKGDLEIVKLLLNAGAHVECVEADKEPEKVAAMNPFGRPRTAAQIRRQERMNAMRNTNKKKGNAVLAAIWRESLTGDRHRRRFGGPMDEEGAKLPETEKTKRREKTAEIVDTLLEWMRDHPEEEGGEEGVRDFIRRAYDTKKWVPGQVSDRPRNTGFGHQSSVTDVNPLNEAVSKLELETVKLLVQKYKANPNVCSAASTNSRETALTAAVMQWQSQEALLEQERQRREQIRNNRERLRSGRGGGFGGFGAGAAPRVMPFDKPDTDAENIDGPIILPRNLSDEIVTFLIEEGGGNVNGWDVEHKLQNKSPLYTAVEKGSVELVKRLVEQYGADLYRVNDSDTKYQFWREGQYKTLVTESVGRAPVHVCAAQRQAYGFGFGRYGANAKAQECKPNPVLEYILDRTGNAAANQCDAMLQTPLFYIVSNCQYSNGQQAEANMRFLIERGAIVDARRAHDGAQPIHCINCGEYSYGHKQQKERRIVQCLLSNGADVNARTNAPYFDTPLHFHAARGNRHLCTVLAEAGADVNAVNGENITPLAAALLVVDHHYQGCGGNEENNDETDENAKLFPNTPFGGTGCRVLNLRNLLKLGAKYDSLRDGPEHTTCFVPGAHPQDIYDLADASGRKTVIRMFKSLRDRVEKDYFAQLSRREADDMDAKKRSEKEFASQMK